MKKYRIREGSIAAKVVAIDNKLNNSFWGVVTMAAVGLIIGGLFAVGMNDIHPLF